MVAVTAVVLPIIENADLEVDLDVQYDAGILTYMIELVNASDESDYYAVVMEGQTVILQQQIFDNYQSNTITDLRNSQEHRVEVRTGTPPLLVVASEVIPATPSWAEWGHLTVDYNSIDYGVYFHGDSGEAVLKLTDPNSGETLYTKELVDGLNSDVIGGLFSSHLYTLAVETETDVLLFKDIQTEYRDVSWNHLTVIDNVIDYGVEVNLGDVEVMISLYDPSTSSVIYSMDLTSGYNADVIRDLEYNHSYELSVASVDETFLFETVITDSEPITVTVGHLTPRDNTIDYELIVSGEGKTVTLDLYDAAGGPSLYTTTITSGSNTGIIEGLDYSHSYLLTVSSASKIYLSESVTTEAEPTKVTLDSLTSTETTVEYKVTVTGNRDVATAYLKDPTSGETLYTKELTVGTNTAVIENLETGHTYQFTVSSKTETYVSREITTGSKPTEVTLNQLTTSDNTIDYEATVTGNSEVVTAYLYDADGEEVYSKELLEGTNPDIIKDLEYDSVYRFTISSETQIYVSEEVTISASITVESLAADGLIINYKMTVNGTEDATITLFSEDYVKIESAPLPAGKTTEGTFRGTGELPIEPNKVYYVKGYINGKEYNLGSVTPESKVITEELSPRADYIFFTIQVIESAGSEMDLHVYNSKGELLEKYSQKYPIKRDRETVEGAIIHIPWGDTYTLKAEIDGQTYSVGEVDIVVEPSFIANGNTIVYSFTVDDKALLTSVYFDSVDGGSVTLSLGQSEDGKFSGTVTKILIIDDEYFVFKWDTEYNFQITSGGTFYEGKVTTDPFNATISNASATGNVVQATVTFGMTNFDDIEVVLYADSDHTEQVAGSAKTPTGSTFAYECSGLEYNKSYYIGVTYNGDLMTDVVAINTGKMPQNPTASEIALEQGVETYVEVDDLEEEPDMSYSVLSGDSADVDEDTGELTWKAAGITVIRASFAETDSYEAGYIDVTVTATKATASITITEGQLFDYTGQTHELATTDKVGTGAVTFAYYDAATGGEAISSPVSAGTYWATATVAADSNYNEFTTNRVSFTINKIIQSVSANAITIESGESKSVSNYISGLEESPSMSYSVTSGSSVSVDATGKLTWLAGGVSTVKASYAETTNYQAGSVNVTVTAKAAAYVEGLPDSFSLLSTGAAQYLVTSDDYTEVVGGTISFYGSNSALTTSILKELTDDDWDAVNNVTRTDTGTYYVYYKITSNDSSYSSLSADDSQVVMVTITTDSPLMGITGDPQYSDNSTVAATYTFNMNLSTRYCKICQWDAERSKWYDYDSDYCSISKTTQNAVVVSCGNLTTGETILTLQIVYTGAEPIVPQKAIHVPEWEPSSSSSRGSPSWINSPGT